MSMLENVNVMLRNKSNILKCVGSIPFLIMLGGMVPAYGQCTDRGVIIGFDTAGTSGGHNGSRGRGRASGSGHLSGTVEAFQEISQRRASSFVGWDFTLSPVPPAPDVEISTDVSVISGLVELFAPPTGGGTADAGAALQLDVFNDGNLVCSDRETLTRRSTRLRHVSESIRQSSQALSCRAGIDPTQSARVETKVTLHVWANKSGPSIGNVNADVKVEIIGFSRCCTNALNAPDGMVPLFSWFSPSRQDNLITSQPTWAGCDGSIRSPDYRFVKKEGFAFDPSRPQPANTLKFYRWWSNDRKDNWATSEHSANGDGRIGLDPSYLFSRLEGYLFANPAPQVTPLHSWWSPDRTDNWVTTQHREAGVRGTNLSPSYRFNRREGYVQTRP